jgi:hypothetical protein
MYEIIEINITYHLVVCFYYIFVSKSYEHLVMSQRIQLDSDCMCSTSMKIEKKTVLHNEFEEKKNLNLYFHKHLKKGLFLLKTREKKI